MRDVCADRLASAEAQASASVSQLDQPQAIPAIDEHQNDQFRGF
jgi:hypothetical protein